jgi:hypothetical protein
MVGASRRHALRIEDPQRCSRGQPGARRSVTPPFATAALEGRPCNPDNGAVGQTGDAGEQAPCRRPCRRKTGPRQRAATQRPGSRRSAAPLPAARAPGPGPPAARHPCAANAAAACTAALPAPAPRPATGAAAGGGAARRGGADAGGVGGGGGVTAAAPYPVTEITTPYPDRGRAAWYSEPSSLILGAHQPAGVVHLCGQDSYKR